MHSRVLSTILAIVMLPIPALADHTGGSPVHVSRDADDIFQVDSGPGLDTPCTFRNDGPLEIELGIDRYYGEVSSTGTLLKRTELVDEGYMPATATLRMPAFDVDRNASPGPGRRPEIDEVWFNGNFVGILSGSNNTWVLNEFEIPIDWIFVPERGSLGQEPTPKVNEIQIRIDTENSEEVWCTAIDWVELRLPGIAPILLVHGVNSGPSTWSRVARFLDLEGVPFEDEIQLGRNDSVDENGQLLGETLPDIAKSFGVRDVHVVAHSKGGLDMRRYLHAHSGAEVNVLSLHTLSTPHHGSVLADISLENRTNPRPESADPDVQAYLDVDDVINFLRRGPKGDALEGLTVDRAVVFNGSNPGTGGAAGFTYGADADLDGNGSISIDELEGFIPFSCPDVLTSQCEALGDLSYRILRDVSEITVVEKTRSFGLIRYTELTPVPTAGPLVNDLAVTDASSRLGGALHDGPRAANHGTIKDRPATRLILDIIRSQFPVD